MTELPAEPKTGSEDTHDRSAAAEPPQFRYVEEFVRYQLGQSLGGARGMIESALPFVAFTIAWVVGRQLYPAIAAAVGTALVLAAIRLLQRQSIKYVAQAIIPTAIAVLVATRTGRAQDVFLPGILYNGALAVISLVTVVIRRPLVGFIIGAAVGDPTGLGEGPRAGEDDIEVDSGTCGAVRHPICHPAAAVSCRGGCLARSGEGRPRLAAADRRLDRHGPDALQGQDANGGFTAGKSSRPLQLSPALHAARIGSFGAAGKVPWFRPPERAASASWRH